MNVSGLVITTLPGLTDAVAGDLKRGSLCEYHAHREGKIIVTIEAGSVSDEIRILKEIAKIENVINVELTYSYCEEELSGEYRRLEINDKLPDWLNDESARAEDIKYNGRLLL